MSISHRSAGRNATLLFDHDRLRALVRECAQELFASYGVATQEIPRLSREHDLAGVIGFTGAMRGTLFIASTTSFFDAASPAPSADTGDWTAELANQLLGRLKNRLLRRGIEIAVATPVVVRGLRLSCSTETPTMFVDLDGGDVGGPVVVGLEAVCDRPLVWNDEHRDAAAAAALDEGSLELF